MKLCCPQQLNKVRTTHSNLLIVHAFNKFYYTEFVLHYRMIDAPGSITNFDCGGKVSLFGMPEQFDYPAAAGISGSLCTADYYECVEDIMVMKKCLSGNVFNFKIAVHEIGHALGFTHEHNRWDCDNYVCCLDYTDKVKENKTHKFSKYGKHENNNYGKFCDYGGIMHYKESQVAHRINCLEGLVFREDIRGCDVPRDCI
uniref:ZnMc domain-containing protein n=1 Tax=Steinernema glaseri TaxID=37863 RepID=A0A1I8AM48_9BILA